MFFSSSFFVFRDRDSGSPRDSAVPPWTQLPWSTELPLVLTGSRSAANLTSVPVLCRYLFLLSCSNLQFHRRSSGLVLSNCSPLAIQRAVQPAPFLSSLDTCSWIMFFPCHSFILCFLFFFVYHLSSHFTPLHFLPLCFPPCVNVYPTVIVFTCLSLSAPHWCILLCPFPSLLAGSSLSTILVFQPFPSVLSDVVPVLCLDLFFVAFGPCMDFAFLPVSFLNGWPVLDWLPGYDTCLSWTSYLVVTLAPCFTFQKSPCFSI